MHLRTRLAGLRRCRLHVYSVREVEHGLDAQHMAGRASPGRRGCMTATANGTRRSTQRRASCRITEASGPPAAAGAHSRSARRRLRCAAATKGIRREHREGARRRTAHGTGPAADTAARERARRQPVTSPCDSVRAALGSLPVFSPCPCPGRASRWKRDTATSNRCVRVAASPCPDACLWTVERRGRSLCNMPWSWPHLLSCTLGTGISGDVFCHWEPTWVTRRCIKLGRRLITAAPRILAL